MASRAEVGAWLELLSNWRALNYFSLGAGCEATDYPTVILTASVSPGEYNCIITLDWSTSRARGRSCGSGSCFFRRKEVGFTVLACQGIRAGIDLLCFREVGQKVESPMRLATSAVESGCLRL
jgi:hypothetical protein